MMKKIYIFPAFILISAILLISCLKPDYNSPFDPGSGYETTPMTGPLILTQLTDSRVQLDWQLNPSIEGSYIIKRKTGGNAFNTIAEVLPTVNTYIDTALSVNITYHYQVIGANDEIQTAPISDSVSTSFALITAFTLAQQDIHTNELNWLHDCDYEEGYLIERNEVTPVAAKQTKKRKKSQQSRDFMQIANLPADTFQYTDDTALPLKDYIYRVTAYTAWNNSPSADAQVNMEFPPPSHLTLTQDNVHTFTLNWQDNCLGEEGFTIERKIDDADYVLIHTTGENITTYTDDLNIRDQFGNVFYKVKALYAGILSDSTEACSAVSFAAPTYAGHQFLTIQSIRINWQDNCPGESGFVIDKKVGSADWQENYASVGENVETWIDNSAEINQILTYRIYAFSGDNRSDILLSPDIDNAFPPPSDLTITQTNVHTFVLNWQDNSNGEEGFTIERKIDAGNYQLIFTTGENITSYTDDINLREQYDTIYYRITAFYQNEYSTALENSLSVSFPAPSYGGLNKLSINTIQLFWIDNSSAEDGFGIDKKVGTTAWQIGFGLVGENIETWTDTTAEINQMLKYRIYAYSGNNQSNYFETPDIDNTFPAPTNLLISQNNVHTFTLNWQDNSIGEEGFTIERKIDAGSYLLIHTTGSNVTSYTDDINTDDQFSTVYYRITAFHQNDYSTSLINSHSITFPAPTYLTHNILSISSIQLNWQDNNNGEEGFRIDKKVGTAAWQIGYGVVAENITTWTDVAAEVAQVLQYRVYAFSAANQSNAVETGVINNVFPAPTALLYQQLTIHSIQLNWQDNSSGEEGFKIDKKVGTAAWQIEYAVVGENIVNWTDTAAEPGENLRYRIYGYHGANNTSAIETGNIDNQFIAPSNLQYERLSISSIHLTWNDNSNGETGFKIDKKVGNYDWFEDYAVLPENTAEWTETAANLNEIVQYRLHAYYDVYASAQTETGAIDNAIPVPADFTLTADDIEITLDWNYSLPGIDGFKLARSVSGGGWNENYASFAAGIFQFTDPGLVVGQSYSYKLRAYFGSDYSNYTSALHYSVSPAGMVFVQGGSFDMGDHLGEGGAEELPVHPVDLNSYYIAECEVTHDEFVAFLNDFGVNSSGSYNGVELIGMNDPNCAIAHNGTSFYFTGNIYAQYEECAVMMVTWFGAAAYCNWLSQQHGLTECYNLNDWSCNFAANGYRLPTEAEWEYAARGGVNWLDNFRFSGCHSGSDLPDYAWYSVNSGGRVQEVGTKLPNQLGIYDMSGNVSEWCHDRYDASYYSVSPVSNPTGPTTGNLRSVRNGSWQGYYGYCRSSYRIGKTPTTRTFNIGFRVIRPF